MGASYSRLKEYDNAIENYKKAIELNPEETIFQNNLKAAYKKLELESAIENSEKVIKSAYNKTGFSIIKICLGGIIILIIYLWAILNKPALHNNYLESLDSETINDSRIEK